MKKHLIAGLLTLSFVITPSLVSAQSIADLAAQINSLLATIATLQAQLSAQTVSTTKLVCFDLQKNLALGSQDFAPNTHVAKLQNFLNSQGFSVAVTGTFATSTKQAVIAFQTANNVVPATTHLGYVGPETREKIKAISCTGAVVTPQASITVLSPNSGKVGSAIQIVGSGFTTSNDISFVASTNAGSSFEGETSFKGVSSFDGKTLNFIVPSTLTQEHISGTTKQIAVVPGLYYVLVATGNSKSNISYFTVISAGATTTPVVTVPPTQPTAPILISKYALSPTAGRVGGEVAIYGTNLSNATKVIFTGGAVSTSVRTFGTDRIIVLIPSGAQNGPVRVCNGDACVSTGESFTLKPSQPTCIDIQKNIALGSRDISPNAHVARLQSFLISQGLMSDITGYFGTVTKNALKVFQTNNGISPVNGYAGPLTREKIKAMSCGTTVVTPQPSITIISPSLGVHLETNVPSHVSWKSTGPNANYTLVYTISGVAGQGVMGSYSPTQANCSNSDTCYIVWPFAFTSPAVTLSVTDTVSGRTGISGVFEVFSNSVQPSITVLSPNGGETFKVGDTVNINWNSSGLSDWKVRIDLAENETVIYTIVPEISNTGSYSWVIPSNSSLIGQRKIVVGSGAPDRSASIYDTSDTVFSISATTPVPIVVTTVNLQAGKDHYFRGPVSLQKLSEAGFSTSATSLVRVDELLTFTNTPPLSSDAPASTLYRKQAGGWYKFGETPEINSTAETSTYFIIRKKVNYPDTTFTLPSGVTYLGSTDVNGTRPW